MYTDTGAHTHTRTDMHTLRLTQACKLLILHSVSAHTTQQCNVCHAKPVGLMGTVALFSHWW